MEPLKSTLPFGEFGETSLAMPSDGALRSGQRRVIEQVTTLRRSRSKYSSKYSPTSPKNDNVFDDFKFSPSTVNGASFTYDSSMLNGSAKTQQHPIKQRSASTRSAAYQREQRNALLPSSPTGQSLPAQPEVFIHPIINYKQTSTNYKPKSPDKHYTQNPLYSNRQSVALNNVQWNSNNQISGTQFITRTLSTNSNPEPKLTVNSKAKSKSEMNGINGELNSSGSLCDGVYLLTRLDENMQLRGASIIQHSTFTSDESKDEVRTLKGIVPLVSLLKSSNPALQETAASALRNIVFKNSANKQVVLDAGGVIDASNLLKNTDSHEIKKHVTGLLWNLSSEKVAHMAIFQHALPVLTEEVLMPYAEQDDLILSEIFCNASACVRNLTSTVQPLSRKCIRENNVLIDSIFKHIQFSIAKDKVNDKVNDKSVENCVGIMQNLTYQLEKEEPEIFTEFHKLDNAPDNLSETVGCFSSQSHKKIMPDVCRIPNIPFKGKNVFIHEKTLQSYTDLLRLSKNSSTQEICIGALHNLTANKNIVSEIFCSRFIGMNGVKALMPLLDSPNLKLKYSIYSLLGILSRTSYTHKRIAEQALPNVFESLNCDIVNKKCAAEGDGALAVGLNTVNKLLRVNPVKWMSTLNTENVNNLVHLSNNGNFPNASKAAGILLQSLWSERNFQTLFRKLGMKKDAFVNDTTTAALYSMQCSE